MELKDYLKIIYQNKRLIFIITLLTGTLTWSWTHYKPTTYQTTINFIINTQQTKQNSSQEEIAYQSIRAAQLAGDSLMSWTITPSVIKNIYKQAEFSLPTDYLHHFKAKRYSPQNIALTYQESNYQRAEKLATEIIDIFTEQTKQLNTADSLPLLNIDVSQPNIVSTKPSIEKTLIPGLVSGFLLGVLASLGKRYLSD